MTTTATPQTLFHKLWQRHLVEQGHVVYMLSWCNPGAEDSELTMDDYLQLGVFDALAAIARLVPGESVHAAGYCLGGTLLSIGAAALALVEAGATGAVDLQDFAQKLTPPRAAWGRGVNKRCSWTRCRPCWRPTRWCWTPWPPNSPSKAA